MSSEQQASAIAAQQGGASNVLSFHRILTISIPEELDLSMGLLYICATSLE